MNKIFGNGYLWNNKSVYFMEDEKMSGKERKIRTTKELIKLIRERQGIDIKKLLTKKGREHEVMSIAMEVLQESGYDVKLIETKKGYDIETNATDEEKKKAIEQAKDLLKMMVASTQRMLRSKLGI
ncbi:MAG TPA: hypothetical protein ENI53_01350 [Thermoplasmatales archaeon]|nr:hypothetical protein [Thermoplasmatales archaeon]